MTKSSSSPRTSGTRRGECTSAFHSLPCAASPRCRVRDFLCLSFADEAAAALPFTTFHHLSPPFTTFHRLPLPFTAFHRLSPWHRRCARRATHSSTLGFDVMGVWSPGMGGSDINNCGRSHNGKWLAMADDSGLVRRAHLSTARHPRAPACAQQVSFTTREEIRRTRQSRLCQQVSVAC